MDECISGVHSIPIFQFCLRVNSFCLYFSIHTHLPLNSSVSMATEIRTCRLKSDNQIGRSNLIQFEFDSVARETQESDVTSTYISSTANIFRQYVLKTM